MMRFLLLLIIFLPCFSFAQIEGTVVDKDTKETIIGARIDASTGEKALSDLDGNFKLNVTTFPVTLIISATTYMNDTIEVSKAGKITINLSPEVQEVKTVVVTAGRRDQEIEDVAISMEILRPELIDNKGVADLEAAVDQSPGVYTMDGQVSIRGGSGFAYGAGSRVLLLWNGMPILSGDAGDAKWNAIPMECSSQIEVLKGASSVLYGSGALNGIISLTERTPGVKPEIRAKIQSGVYGNPNRPELKWWSSNPMFHLADFYYGRMLKNVGFTVAASGYSDEGYKQGANEHRGRFSGTLFIRPQEMPKLKAGIGYNVQYQQNGNFIIWDSDSTAYIPSGGADTSNVESTLTYQKGIRWSIDPYVKVFDKNNNLHTVKTRYYYVKNNNLSNADQSTASGVTYGDYQFQHKWDKGIVLTSGLTYIRTDVNSALFGSHHSNNIAAYSQYEHRFDKLDLTGGLRLEHFDQDGQYGDSYYYFDKSDTTGSKLPFYPIARVGAHYQVAKGTHLRASFGQGIRYPTVAERYTNTSVGALNIFANPYLKPEIGWAAELGFKQVVLIGKEWKGIIDVAGFINQYDNMMEFTFGEYKPDSIPWSLDPNNPGYVNKWFGFQARNAEKARISGIEFSFNSIGKIKNVEITSLLGYTYMNPVSLNSDSAYVSTFSTYNDTTQTYDPTLKYRFNHLAKADIQADWKGFSIGVSMRYNSYMKNIDKIFEREIIPGLYILPGLKKYREEFNKGTTVFDARFAYKINEHFRVGVIVNNLLNTEYVSRPGDVQAPRNYILQLQMKF